MILQQALSVLSKSSKYSVSTLRKDGAVDEYQALKDRLYITPDIQVDFKNALKSATGAEIFCLCGSSGDGKSEILTQLYEEHCREIDFHLDATHSKSQHKSAIDCLNDTFDGFKVSRKSLALGINIGMLQKFIKLGAQRHEDIKLSFQEYFVSRHVKGFTLEHVSFYDFECYPRLDFSSRQITSDFITSFLKRLTEQTLSNPFWCCYKAEISSGSYIAKNFAVLSRESFQLKLVELFGLARLLDEQFLIPRIFVDFIYQILTIKNPDGIIGNVFSQFNNEFSHSFVKIDPLKSRNSQIDSFYLEFTTDTLSVDSAKTIDGLNTLTGITLSPQGVIRAAYLLNDKMVGETFDEFFNDSLLNQAFRCYLNLIDLSEKDSLTAADEEIYYNIVETIIVGAALDYANRLLPTKEEAFIVSRQLKDFSICNKVIIQADLDWFRKQELVSTDAIPIGLEVNNKQLLKFSIDLNMMLQAITISKGHRPNRQNLEVIAKFDELIDQIVQRTIDTESMKLLSNNKTLVVNQNSGRYRVEGY